MKRRPAKQPPHIMDLLSLSRDSKFRCGTPELAEEASGTCIDIHVPKDWQRQKRARRLSGRASTKGENVHGPKEE